MMTDYTKAIGADDDLYYGFIQAICWTVGADGQNPTTINEPDHLWSPSRNGGRGDEINFSRADFLRCFAEFDSDSPIMLLKLLAEGSWVIFCTEHDDCIDLDVADEQGFAYAAEWADRG